MRVKQIGKFVQNAARKPKVKFTGGAETEPVVEEELEWRRTKASRARIGEVLAEFNKLDLAAFPRNPTFDPTTGALRMTFEGASSIQLSQIMGYGAEAIEVMFAHHRKPALYSESVARLFEQVRQQLTRGTRQGWMKLVREVSEWILLQLKV